MSEVLVIGSLAYDAISTPAGKVDRTLGGSANYFSLAASMWSQVRVVGVVGEDYEASALKMLESRKVDLSGVQKQAGKTFFWKGRYEGSLNEAITEVTDLNVFESFNPVIPDQFKDSKFVFLANIAPHLQLEVLSQVKEPLFVGMDTMNFWIQSALPKLKEVLAKVDVVLINETEAQAITGGHNAIQAAERLSKMGEKSVVIKRGEYGFVLYHPQDGFHILPAFPLPTVVDPTGAGDSFAGAFFGYLASLNRKPSGLDLRQACKLGTLTASFTIQDFGVKRLSELTQNELLRRGEVYKNVVEMRS